MSFRRFLALGAFFLATSVVPLSAFAQATAISNGIRGAADAGGLSGGCSSGTECVANIIGNVIGIATGFLGVVLFGYFLYAGFLWTTAGGDTGQVDKAKSYIKNAVIGLVIVVTAFAISTFVLGQIDSITNPATGGGIQQGAGSGSGSTPGPGGSTIGQPMQTN